MFLGHFGLAFAAKKLDRKPSLGTTFFAAQFVDLLWPFFLLTGIEKVAVDPGNTKFTPLNFVSYPYSHSLAGALIWAALFGMAYFLIRKNRKSAMITAFLVVSHWLLDLLTHRPDLPLSFGESAKYGMGLWNNKLATIIIELAIFFVGVILYATATKAENKWGNLSFYSLVIFFMVIYLMNVFGSPPPDAMAIAYVGLAQWLLVAWGYWTDANRISDIRAPAFNMG